MATWKEHELKAVGDVTRSEFDRVFPNDEARKACLVALRGHDDDDSDEQEQHPQPPLQDDGSQRDPDELIKSWRREDGPEKEER